MPQLSSLPQSPSKEYTLFELPNPVRLITSKVLAPP